MTRKEPMTAKEAQENIEQMTRETPKPAARKLIKLALGPLGNLSSAARVVYRSALESEFK